MGLSRQQSRQVPASDFGTDPHFVLDCLAVDGLFVGLELEDDPSGQDLVVDRGLCANDVLDGRVAAVRVVDQVGEAAGYGSFYTFGGS